MSKLPNPIHIPTGHELVKRYDPVRFSDQGGWSWDSDAVKECDDGDFVRIDEVKAHLLKWLRDELAKGGAAAPADMFLDGYHFALNGTIHHIEHIL